MGISLQTVYDTQHLVRIDPSLSKAIEILWNGGSPIEMDSLNQNWITHDEKPASSDDEELLQKFLAKDFAKPSDISKILSALEKRFVESNLFRRELGYVFAADGVLDDGPICFERYSDHLAIPKTLGEPIDDDHPNEDPMEAHVRAVRTIYRDVKYVTPERIGATLRRLLKVEKPADDPPKRRGDNRSTASSENSSGDSSSNNSSGDDHWQDHYDKYIADQYQKLVGKKINIIIQWMRERFRRRKEEEAENLRKRAIATKRKRVTFESTDPKTLLIKDMAKKSPPDSQTDPPTTMTEPEKVISSAAATVTTVVAVTDPKPKTKKKKKTKPKKSEETEGTKRKNSEKITQSKKVKKTTTDEVEKETRSNEEAAESIETVETPAEPVPKCDKESDNGSETKENHE